MKWAILILSIVFLWLQVRLWSTDGGILEIWSLKNKYQTLSSQYKSDADRNQVLDADVRDLKYGMEAVEERAREEFGLIKENETFYQIVESTA